MSDLISLEALWLAAVEKIDEMPSAESKCEKCYWSEEKGCSIFCRAWNRYTAPGGFCHQYANMRGEEDE